MRLSLPIATATLLLGLTGWSVDGAAPRLQGDLGAAQAVVQRLCQACHGMDGNGTSPSVPKLAGQHPEYLLKELLDFRAEHRASPVMTPILNPLSEQDLANLALYFAAQPRDPATATRPELIPTGKALFHNGNRGAGIAPCADCHEEDGRGDADVPSLAGQIRPMS